jgi:hypothetical protein
MQARSDSMDDPANSNLNPIAASNPIQIQDMISQVQT